MGSHIPLLHIIPQAPHTQSSKSTLDTYTEMTGWNLRRLHGISPSTVRYTFKSPAHWRHTNEKTARADEDQATLVQGHLEFLFPDITFSTGDIVRIEPEGYSTVNTINMPVMTWCVEFSDNAFQKVIDSDNRKKASDTSEASTSTPSGDALAKVDDSEKPSDASESNVASSSNDHHPASTE